MRGTLMSLGHSFIRVTNFGRAHSVPANAGDLDSIPGSGRSPGEGHGYPLPYSYLENPLDRGAGRTTVHGIAKSWT